MQCGSQPLFRCFVGCRLRVTTNAMDQVFVVSLFRSSLKNETIEQRRSTCFQRLLNTPHIATRPHVGHNP
jgi:hypothetical protein